jgi:hypothetical protein
MILSVLGNKSKQVILGATEQIRCRCLLTEQVRCQVFACGQIGCFMKKLRLCEQVGYFESIVQNMLETWKVGERLGT